MSAGIIAAYLEANDLQKFPSELGDHKASTSASEADAAAFVGISNPGPCTDSTNWMPLSKTRTPNSGF